MKSASVKLSQANLDHCHIYLSGVLDFFPIESIGGRNKEAASASPVEIHYGADRPVVTDIAGDKKIFRSRSWVREFFRIHNVTAGTEIVFEKIGPGRYRVYPQE